MKNTNHKYLCWLAGIRGIGRKKKFALMQAAGEASLFSMVAEDGIFSTEKETGSFSLEAAGDEQDPGLAARLLYTAPEKELRFLWGEAGAKTPGSREEWQALLNARGQEPERIEEELARAGIGFISALEEGFPEKLREIPDPPFGIYYKGSMPVENEPAAAIIGARLASGYGREQARRFGRRIGARGISVISGMARGIDGIAQKAALDAGGRSYAVLGCGVDICYPEENRELYQRLQQQGGVLSEYPPGMQPIARLFPPRNRIISGLSDLVLVIEARKRSGTLITVDMALEQGREVYALPGRVSDALSDGCNRLIRQGAGPATCPQDILEYFFGTGSEEEGIKGERKAAKTMKREPEPSGRIKIDQESIEKENRAEAYPQIIDQQNAEMKEEGWLETGLKNRNLQNAEMQEEDWNSAEMQEEEWEDTERHQEHNLEQTAPETPETLDRRILRLLSSEDEKHIERILEEVNGPDPFSDSAKAEVPVSLSELVSCLMRLKMDGKVQEAASGYFSRTGQ